MIVLDAYAVLALLKAEPAAPIVQALLEGDEPSALGAAGVAEVLDHLVRVASVEEEVAMLDLAQLGLAAPLVVDGHIAAGAGLLRARHFHPRDRQVSLADCLAAHTALTAGASVATADSHLLDMCADEGIEVMPLPGSDGVTWTPRP